MDFLGIDVAPVPDIGAGAVDADISTNSMHMDACGRIHGASISVVGGITVATPCRIVGMVVVSCGGVGAPHPVVGRTAVDAFAVIRHDRQKLRESSHAWNTCGESLPVTKTVVGLNHVVPNPDGHRIWGEIVEALFGRDGESDLVAASIQHAEHASDLLDIGDGDFAH